MRIVNFWIVYAEGFELSTWSTSRGFTPGSALPEHGVLRLLKDLGLAMYMKDTSCSHSDDLYVNSSLSDGWNDGGWMS